MTVFNPPLNPISIPAAAALRIPHQAERHYGKTRLLVFDQPAAEQGRVHHQSMNDLDQWLNTGDVLVVNRSATLPSAFQVQVLSRALQFELRLAAFQGPSPAQPLYWQAVSFGAGSWREATEARGPAPLLYVGDELYFGPELSAQVLAVEHGRVLTLRFESENLLAALYRYGKPIQYAYHEAPLEIWDQQTLISGPPISVEPPSASFALTADLLLRLVHKGVRVVSLLHSAGLSSTGEAALDALLPLNEWYHLPEDTVQAIHTARQTGGRVMALGTTVMRALESAAQKPSARGGLQAGEGLSRLQIRPGYRFQVVDRLVTGMHEPDSSHMHILKTLCPLSLIQQGYQKAAASGYRGHEYGDLSLLACDCAR